MSTCSGRDSRAIRVINMNYLAVLKRPKSRLVWVNVETLLKLMSGVACIRSSPVKTYHFIPLLCY